MNGGKDGSMGRGGVSEEASEKDMKGKKKG